MGFGDERGDGGYRESGLPDVWRGQVEGKARFEPSERQELIAEAKKRFSINRLGRDWARETDKDLIIIQRLIKELEKD